MSSRFLDARDERDRELHRALAQCGDAASILFVGCNVPGPAKARPGLSRLAQGALDGLEVQAVHSGFDALGPFHIAFSAGDPVQVKAAAVALEGLTPSGRLLDIDVYRPDGTQVDRASLGLPQRPCLLCEEPARECIRAGRHGQAELLAKVDALLHEHGAPQRLLPGTLAATLHLGAIRELDLTPKPGLVDRHDAGSHPDLTYEAMRASADLLPRYFEDLLARFGERRSLNELNQAGRDAEDRMLREIGTNAHKGYIFLSGLTLLAACQCRGRLAQLRPAIMDLAAKFFVACPPQGTHGADLRARQGLGGIRAEALQGLPAVFEHGWPAYRRALESGLEPRIAGFHLMAALMATVEDTTAVRRCGPEGLQRLRQDAQALQELLDLGRDPEPFLAALNEDYRRMNLTMGGVADCMALTWALHAASA
ncbi:triphosphoribosyl-dephospho-CoA synthase [Mesoterricola silvestris]|uniref:Citrate lyase holo-[acyl-carrier protein] synthase n=1 Tax=Mesoterricola silvestris TaxID=2927979 RepID=A0AA48GMF6_9BACT|nr:triphosphoribosyl-dephospho-CoA synthase [Mesoterricola silvestris]BDU74112.1 hypothetical protein METEAL_32860 [Mesoterricola silvestris]